MHDHISIIEQIEKIIRQPFAKTNVNLISRPYHAENCFSQDKGGRITGLHLKNIGLEDFRQIIDIVTSLPITTLSGDNIKVDEFKIVLLNDLEELSFSNCELSELSAIPNIVGLKKLILNGCKLKDVTKLGNLINLDYLDLSDNELNEILFISKLDNLEFLWLANNPISNIECLIKLKKLSRLGLGANKKIESFEPLRGPLKFVELNLANNNISDLSFLEDTVSIDYLELANNNISNIEPLKNLRGLYHLSLFSNKISRIPKWLIDYYSVPSSQGNLSENTLNLANNPLIEPPVEIANQGIKAMAAWFEGQKVFVNEVKVLLVGHGEVGKTTLVKCLTGKQPDPKEKATHHINISSHDVDCYGKKVKLHFWDFGGQEVMHSTHQFFLSKRSIYLLLLDGRRDEDPEYWLKHIESFGGDSPVLMVLNKVDTNPSFEVDRRFLMNKYPFIFGFYRTVCLGKIQGIDDLNAGISNALGNVEILSSPWPKSWVEIKKSLESMPNDFISQQTYEELCEKNAVSENETKEILAEYLNDLGVVVHFKDLRLSDLHILQPRWASRAAYKVINSAKVAANHGLLKVEWLKEIMKKESEDDFLYKEYTFPFILDLMQKFELCYAIDDSIYLIPELMDIQQPVLPEHSGAVLTFYLKYDGILPKSILAKFIVRMHEDIHEQLTWRTGTVLSVEIFNSLAVVIADTKDKKISITVSGRNRREHFALIRKTFRSLNDDFEKLVVKELIPLPDHDDMAIEYDELIGHEEAGIKYYFSGKLKKSFSVKDLLNGIEPESSRKKEFFWDVFLCHSSRDKPTLREIIEDLKKRKISYWLDEEQIQPGDSPIDKITEGLVKSRFIAPLISENQLKSGWSRNEYQAILTKILNGKTNQKITALILDATADDDVPLFLSTLRYERYQNAEQYTRLLDFFSQYTRQ